MGAKLSYSCINTYTTCGYKYFRHYINRERSIFFHSALAFGSALDSALNILLKEKDYQKALDVFDQTWFKQYVNGKQVELPQFENLVYADSDFDDELLDDEDWNYVGGKGALLEYSRIKEEKRDKGFINLSIEDRKFYNYCNWLSLKRKGHVMLKSYLEKVIPHIRKVLAVQYESALTNSEGDTVLQVVDLIVEWEDGSIILFDNKTSARAYDEDAAKTSQQLISYYYQNKEKFGLTCVGFIVLNKHIIKNKEKICQICGKKSESNRVKTCAFEVNGKRCGGEFNEILNPEAAIQILTSPVSEAAEDLVLSTFDEANNGIKNKLFYKNLLACNSGYKCPFYASCWFGDNSELMTLPKKSTEEK